MDRVTRLLSRLSPARQRDLLALASMGAITGGVLYVFGPGWAAIVCGLLGLAGAVAWAVLARVEGAA